MSRRPCLRLVVALAAVMLATGGVAHGQNSSPTPRPGADVASAEDQVVLSGTVTVPRGQSVGEVVVFHGRAAVAGVVVGDVVVLDGPVVIAGQVSGTVVAMNGPIRLAATGSVGGDVLGAGDVRLDPGALVGGEVRDHVRFTPRGTLAALGALLGAVAIAVSALLLVLLLLALAPRALDRVATAARTAPFASFAWGVVVALALPAVAVLSAASILGLPLGLSLLLAFALVALIGYALATYAIGRLIVREPRGRVGALFAGWGAAAAIGLVPFLNVVAWGLGSTFGLGAAVVAIWRARSAAPSRGRHRVGYAPVAATITIPPADPSPADPSPAASMPTGDPAGGAAEAPDTPRPAEAYPVASDD
jgi:hypothetical protein